MQSIDIGQILQGYNPMALYEAQQKYNKASEKESGSYNLASGNFSSAGGLGMAANIIGALLNRKHKKSTDSAQSDYMRMQFQNQLMQQQKASEVADKQREQKIRREDQVAARDHGYKMTEIGAKDNSTSLMKNAIAAGFDPKTPEGQAFIKQQMSKSGAPVVNVNNGKTESAFAQQLAKNNAAKFNDWESNAIAGNEMVSKLGAIKQISQLQQTGKVQEAQAYIGQIFGTEAASNMQAFNAAQKNLMLDAASSLSGAMSDGEWKVLQAQMPAFGNDPRANEQIIGILESAAQRSIDRYQKAADYVEQNGKLQGFRPEFQTSERQAPQQEQQSQAPVYAVNPQTGERLVLKNGQWVKE